MSEIKLIDSTQLDTDLTSIANAIRTKGGTSASLAFPAGFVSAVEAISTASGGDSGSSKEKEIIDRTISGAYANSEVMVVGAYAFCSCSSLTAVSFPACTEILSYAFSGCASLSTVSFPNCTIISAGVFSNCHNLETAYFPELSNTNIYAFHNCYRLSSIVTKPLSVISERTFQNCSLLTNVSFASSVSIGSSAFASTNFSILYLSRANIGSAAFMNCKALSECTIDLIDRIGSSAFLSCGLVTVSFNRIISTAFNYAGYVFSGCKSLKSVYFGPGITSALKYSIPLSGFAGCNNLATVCFRAAGYIATSTFYNCYNLLSLYLLFKSNTITSLGAVNAFANTPISTYTTSTGGVYGSIFVPASMYSSYISATNWVNYSSRFVSMTDEEIEAFLNSL